MSFVFRATNTNTVSGLHTPTHMLTNMWLWCVLDMHKLS